MKHTKISRIFGIAIILSLLMLAIPASPALAAGDLELDPEEGEIGDEIEIVGDGFNASTADDSEQVILYFSSQEADTSDDIDSDVDIYEIIDSYEWVNEQGEFDTTFDIPAELTDGDDDEDVTSGTYYVYACYQSEGGTIYTRIMDNNSANFKLSKASLLFSSSPAISYL